MTMSVFVYDAVDLCKYSTKKIYVMFSLKCMSSGPKNTMRADPDLPPFLSRDLICK